MSNKIICPRCENEKEGKEGEIFEYCDICKCCKHNNIVIEEDGKTKCLKCGKKNILTNEEKQKRKKIIEERKNIIEYRKSEEYKKQYRHFLYLKRTKNNLYHENKYKFLQKTLKTPGVYSDDVHMGQYRVEINKKKYSICKTCKKYFFSYNAQKYCTKNCNPLTIKNKEKQNKIILMHDSGITAIEISKIYNISRERVRQILNKFGKNQGRDITKNNVFKKRKEIIEYIKNGGIKSNEMFVLLFGVSKTSVRKELSKDEYFSEKIEKFGVRKCCMCGEIKKLDLFCKNKLDKNYGKSYRCKECSLKYSKKYYFKNNC